MDRLFNKTTLLTYGSGLLTLLIGSKLYFDYTSDTAVIRRHVHHALQLSSQDDPQEKAIRWNEALTAAQKSSIATPIVKFHLAFAVACALDEDKEKSIQAEKAFKKALKMLQGEQSINDDLHKLRMGTRIRIATVLDRLANKAQDRNEKDEAKLLYLRALDVLGPMNDVQAIEQGNFPPQIVENYDQCYTYAGVLHNLSTLIGDESFHTRAIQLLRKCEEKHLDGDHHHNKKRSSNNNNEDDIKDRELVKKR
jgi:hypothetical protein